MSGVDNLEIEQGDSWQVTVVWTDEATGDPVDVSAYSAEWVARAPGVDGGLLLALDDTDGINVGSADGTFTISRSGAETALLDGGATGVYNFFATSPGGTVYKLLRGQVSIVPRVEQAP